MTDIVDRLRIERNLISLFASLRDSGPDGLALENGLGHVLNDAEAEIESLRSRQSCENGQPYICHALASARARLVEAERKLPCGHHHSLDDSYGGCVLCTTVKCHEALETELAGAEALLPIVRPMVESYRRKHERAYAAAERKLHTEYMEDHAETISKCDRALAVIDAFLNRGKP